MTPGWTGRLPEARTPGYLGRRFGNLRLRLKLITLHNFFFLILSSSVYFTVFPLLEQRVEGDKRREIALITHLLQTDEALRTPGESRVLRGLENYSVAEGTAEELQIPAAIRAWTDAHPGEVYPDPLGGHPALFRRLPDSPLYRTVRLPHDYYRNSLQLVRIALFTVLGIIYVLAVLLLELVIMPLYVYRPLVAMLSADHASQTGDRANEIIPEEYIPGDEIGQIMRSRNQTISELRRQEENLEQALERLETAKRKMADQDRLVSLGMLSAGVAHELNTPLAVLQGSIEKLLETVKDPPALDRLQRMQRVASRLKTISEGLLDFSRVRGDEKQEIYMRPLVEEAWQLISLDEKAPHTQFINDVPVDCRVYGNADRLMQVLVNLLRNALQATPQQGGEIRALAQLQREQAERWWVIAVEDNGPGIPADVLPDIFEAFISTKLDSKGTGLGLTVSEGIIHQHGGTISAANKPGGGARLEIRLAEAPINIAATGHAGGNNAYGA